MLHYPGAQQAQRRLIAKPADSCFLFWFEYHSLHVNYRLPEGADVDAAKAHYRSHLPSGWKEADDSACKVGTDAPPGVTPRTDHLRLSVPDNRLLLENSKGKRVTVVVDPPTLTLRPAEYSCFPASLFN